jgi:predicted MPP superfamily phosphohydrolase
MSEEKQGFSLQIASDLHVEFLKTSSMKEEAKDQWITPQAPYLALVGDIGTPAIPKQLQDYQDFLLNAAEKFTKVYVLTGNHEYYVHGGERAAQVPMKEVTMGKINERVQKVCSQRDNLVFLNRSFDIIQSGGKTIRVVGVVLWSSVPDDKVSIIEEKMNDFKHVFVEDPDSESGVRKLRVSDTNAMHKADVEFLQEQARIAAAENQDLIILSHFAPSFKDTSNPKFKDDPNQCAFATDLEYFFKTTEYSALKLWAFGHTHHCVDKTLGHARLIANQRGYHPFDVVSEFNPSTVYHLQE